jgi:predicted nucleotidyltransferase
VFNPAARMNLFRLAALKRRIAEILGQRVDLLPESVQQPRLQANIDRDRRRAFFSNAVLPYDAPPPRNSPE